MVLRWLHILAIISWMAGLLYIFRLFIYHVENRDSKDVQRIFPVMERRLYRVITLPAMLVAIVAAVGILWLAPVLISQLWMQIKIACALGMVGFTAYAGQLVDLFTDPQQAWPSSRRLRFLNEGPTLLMMIMVGMVVFRPL